MFITIEGPDGGGKTTQVRLLYDALKAAGVDVLLTREPGGTSIGDQIRTVLHDVDNKEMNPAAEILLYSASRAQLVAQVIRPALASDRVVLCDRYADSTMAYQGYGRQLDLDALRTITHFATGGLTPDLTLLLDLPVEAGLARRRTGGDEWNRMDQQTLEFHRRTRDGYLQLAAAEPERWVRIDADAPEERVAGEVWKVVRRALGLAEAERPCKT
jgi:dTMP kinase